MPLISEESAYRAKADRAHPRAGCLVPITNLPAALNE